MAHAKKNRRASVVRDDLLAETVYNPITKETSFFVYHFGLGKPPAYASSVDDEIFPLDAKSDIVSKDVVLLPSWTEEYGSSEELLKEIQAFIHKYVDISESFERISAHYVLLSWIYDRLYELPYLRARGDYGTGKSRYIRVVGSVCYRPIFTAGATTTSPIFRILDEMHGTLILDEADLNVSDAKSDLVKILNTGYQKGTTVLRTEGNGRGGWNVRSYDVYGPKIVATRQNFDDHALESRFLIEDMGKSTLRKDIPIRLSGDFTQDAWKLRNKLLKWRFDNFLTPLIFEDKHIDGLHPRLQQIITPLLAILPGEQMRETLLAHALRYNEELAVARGMSWESQAIIAILRLHENTKTDRIGIKDITDEINRELDIMEDNLSPKKVGWVLRTLLQIKAQRMNTGFSISFKRNEDKIMYWRERLAITDETVRGEEVNDVNVAQPTPLEDKIRPEDNPF